MGPWAERPAAAREAVEGPASKLAGSVFDLFADVEFYCAQRGIDPEPREIWEVAAALGLHRVPDEPAAALAPEPEPASPWPAAQGTDAIAEMVRNHMREMETGERPQWGPPTAAERAQQRSLMGI